MKCPICNKDTKQLFLTKDGQKCRTCKAFPQASGSETMKTTTLEQAFLDFLQTPNATVGSIAKMTDAIKVSDQLLRRCLKALDLEAQASEHFPYGFNLPPKKCTAWYKIRAEIRDALFPNVAGERPAITPK